MKSANNIIEVDYMQVPHGGRPPSDEAVKAATRRYVIEGFCSGSRPSEDWMLEHNIWTWREAAIVADKENIYWSKRVFPR